MVLLQRHVVETAHFADALERRLQLGQAFHGAVGADVLVMVENHEAVLILDRHDGLGEVAARPGRRGLLLRPQRVGVDVLAGEALDGRDQVGADALGHEADRVIGFRVGRPGAAVGTHRHPRHGLDAAGQHQVVPAGADLLRGRVHGLQAGRTEPVELHATGGVGQAGSQHRGAGDVAALVTDGRDDTKDDVADQVLVEVGEPGPQFVDQADDEVQWLDLVQ